MAPRHPEQDPGLRARNELRHNDVVKYMGQAEARATGAPDAGSRLPAVPQTDGSAPDSNTSLGAGGLGSERGTRGRIARLILENGPATAAGLSDRLGLTPAAVRRHLDNLLADGMIEPRVARSYGSRRRGRPARMFAITDAGRSVFEHAYDDLASSALRFIAETAGPEAIARFARQQVAEWERRYRPAVEAAEPGERVRALAEALTADGYAACATPTPSQNTTQNQTPAPGRGEQLCQHHCPVAHVAEQYPELCEAETEAFGRLLGTPVQRLATIAHGDGICTTHVTAAGLKPGRTTDNGGISA
jgi:predicted ArsR family transcriptional regulator